MDGIEDSGRGQSRRDPGKQRSIPARCGCVSKLRIPSVSAQRHRTPCNGLSPHVMRSRLALDAAKSYWSRGPSLSMLLHPIPPNTIGRANRGPAFRLNAGRKFESPSCAPPSLSAAVAHLWRWATGTQAPLSLNPLQGESDDPYEQAVRDKCA